MKLQNGSAKNKKVKFDIFGGGIFGTSGVC